MELMDDIKSGGERENMTKGTVPDAWKQSQLQQILAHFI